MIDEDLRRFVDDLLDEFNAQQRASRGVAYHQYSAGDFDVFDYEEPEDNGSLCPDCGVELTEEVEVVDYSTGNTLPTYSCPECGNTYVLTDHVPAPEPPAWKQTSWWKRALGGK
jgi:hypothetical protein